MRKAPLPTLFLAAILVAASVRAADPPRRSSQSVIEEITRLVTVEWPQANERCDARWFDRHFAEELLMINGQTGEVTTKAQELASICAAQPVDDSTNKIEDLRINVYGDVADAAYRIDFSGTDRTGPWFRTARSTEVWVIRDGRWQVVALHSNPLPGHVHEPAVVPDMEPTSNPPPPLD